MYEILEKFHLIVAHQTLKMLLHYLVKSKKTSLMHTHTHARMFNGPWSGTTWIVGTRKVKPICILLKQETVSGSGISWAICKSAPGSKQIITPAPDHSVFTGPMTFLLPIQQRQSTEGHLQ